MQDGQQCEQCESPANVDGIAGVGSHAGTLRILKLENLVESSQRERWKQEESWMGQEQSPFLQCQRRRLLQRLRCTG